ncbi:uncharacterized protein LOC131854203 [Achroia grisella]|uniref:uncharacterized protein LOC131854203 n=1 Tax=Achroia grisella TaxID=688607 RepID=UPI0027D21689|nr:uncharacterized protein LOC131854203 [Achroia grisella]
MAHTAMMRSPSYCSSAPCNIMNLCFKVAPITEKLTESLLRWYGHVMRSDEDYVVKKALKLPECKRGRGRPPATWWTSMNKLVAAEKLPDPTTQARLSWRRKIRRADPA